MVTVVTPEVLPPEPSNYSRDRVLASIRATLATLPWGCSVTARMFSEFNQASVSKALKNLASKGELVMTTDKAKYGLTIYHTLGTWGDAPVIKTGDASIPLDNALEKA